ncbi:outer membrane protein assembly factor BamE [Flocculibacter collagenilyticus]|uniref:outer membrane protein assembly factor BamE n=1 Tax=Flocculibacter collagenilyticus TaxID=2744479 RepID=UPI0018F44AB3|nr:outer membrane protein assembly factor BamE [Flocculibacter collagenilyticus]
MNLRKVILFFFALSLAGCSNWIYRINIPQGNFIEQKEVDKLRIRMTKEQVLYVLGTPMAENAFDKSKWHYLYMMKTGEGNKFRKELVIHFENDALKEISGDFEKHEDFDTPLDG